MPGDQDLVASDTSEGATPKPVHHVSVKPSLFMESAVPGWFAIMDAQFHIAKITSAQTKFYHVLSSLPPETISHIPQDVLEQKDFKVLQETVTDMYEKTKPELFERLISKTRLTGRPSHFLSELREMGDKAGVGDELIRQNSCSRFRLESPQLWVPSVRCLFPSWVSWPMSSCLWCRGPLQLSMWHLLRVTCPRLV